MSLLASLGEGNTIWKNCWQGSGGGSQKNWDNVVYGWTKKECQTTHHPECKKIPHTVYVEKCDVNTEQKCETVYESVQAKLYIPSTLNTDWLSKKQEIMVWIMGYCFHFFQVFGWKNILNWLENSGLKSRLLFCLRFLVIFW